MREARWAELERWAETFGEGEDPWPIDEGIKPLVIALNALGLPTYCSCEGHHLDHPHPSVQIQAPDEPEDRRVMGPYGDWIDRNLSLLAACLSLVDEFYAERPDVLGSRAALQVNADSEAGTFCLSPRYAFAMSVFPSGERVAFLAEAQRECTLLAEFLKRRYFAHGPRSFPPAARSFRDLYA